MMSFCEETRKRGKIWIVEAVSLFWSETREHLELQRIMSKCPFLLHFFAKSGQIWGDFIEKLELRQTSGL